jgi:uncharacterized protein YndB with AHSA1/START domain
VPGFEAEALCRAPAIEAWKLLYDPKRFPDWWAGLARVEAGDDGELTRYMEAWPDFAYPTHVSARQEGSRVVVSCLLSNIVHEWSLEPAAEGCLVRVRVEVPEDEAARLEAVRAETLPSLERLVAVAERTALSGAGDG